MFVLPQEKEYFFLYSMTEDQVRHRLFAGLQGSLSLCLSGESSELVVASASSNP